MACEYCRSKHLVCFTIVGQASNVACNACTSLFRSCSFVEDPATRRAKAGHLDTLQPLPEDLAQESGGLTSTKPLISRGATYQDIVEDQEERRPGKSFKRFPRASVHLLKNWLNSHADHPYPSDEEKEELKQVTGLTLSQISNWLANARRRSKPRAKRPQSPLLDVLVGSHPISIPQRPENIENMTPLERWKISPPENEPARINDIARAIEVTDMDLDFHSSGQTSRAQSASDILYRHSNSTPGSVLSTYQEPSISSFDTGNSSGSFGASSSFSHASSRGSYGAFARKEQRRRKKIVRKATANTSAKPATSQHRPYQCTFCTDSFPSKYDWTRHEKSLHLSLERWICAPLGPVITSAAGVKQCVYCELPEPSPEHLELHNHSDCEEKGHAARTFYRKDHLRQHLRLVHDTTKLIESMESWRVAPATVRSRCGFCAANFTTWTERSEHLAKHYRDGAKICDWKGGWGFDPEVEASVANAMPPFLIGAEAKTPAPFRASDSTRCSVRCTPDDITTPRGATCWEILTTRMGQYVRELQMHGQVVTDAMLQAKGREIIYGSADDEWNQTAADNPEWLCLFKQAHGLASSPEAAGSSTTSNAAAASLKALNDELYIDRSAECKTRNGQDSVGFGGIETLLTEDLYTEESASSSLSPEKASKTDAAIESTDWSMALDFSAADLGPAPEWDASLFPQGHGQTDDFGSFDDILFG